MVQNACEIIKKKLYFLSSDKSTFRSQDTVVINIDYEYYYRGYYGDFGPLNISCIYKYCQDLNRKLKLYASTMKKIVHLTSTNSRKKVNSAFLMGCFLIAYLKMTPQETYKALSQNNYRYISFRDAAIGRSTFHLSLINCLRGFDKAISCRILKIRILNVNEYDHYDNIQNGDINWIIPRKILAFTGPRYKTQLIQGYLYHTPEMYVSIFHKWRISTVIRLNSPEYDEKVFIKAGINHHNLIFPDGGVPSERLVRKFFEIVDTSVGGVAVHCKAGLGRTGTLIGCYLMKQYKFTAGEAIAWIRICRPGSVIGYQQNWLMDHQAWCWRIGPMHQNVVRRTFSSKTGDNRAKLSALNNYDIKVPKNPFYDTSDKDISLIPQGDMLNSIKSFNRISQNLLETKTSSGVHNILLDDSNIPQFGRNKGSFRQYNRQSLFSTDSYDDSEYFKHKSTDSLQGIGKQLDDRRPPSEQNDSIIIPDFDIRQLPLKFLTSKSREY